MFQTSSNDVVYVLGVTLQNKTLKFFSHKAKLKSLLKLKFFLCVCEKNEFGNILKFP